LSGEEVPKCGDGILQAGEDCDPEMTIEACQARYGWSAEKCQLIKEKCRPKGDPHECTVEYCGDGIVQTGEDCDPQQSVSDCVQNTQKTTKECTKLIGSCGRDCKLVEIPNDVVVDDDR